MADTTRVLKFNGTPGGYFVAALVSSVMWYVLIIGWPIAFNFMNGWIVDNLEVNGRKMKYEAEYGETFSLLFVGFLLTLITFGIYSFWFIPKCYRFVVEHSRYADEAAETKPAA